MYNNLNLSIKKTQCSELQSKLVRFDVGKNVNLTKKPLKHRNLAQTSNFLNLKFDVESPKVTHLFALVELDNYRTYSSMAVFERNNNF